ncbi:MAG: Coenzyme F420 hydrogenase/dehydrogenase, beta subunit C-terminal domain [Desulfarculus sp.]|nr:Coenzyme F420 hydrogenase/dehydrogenase, beta subunit C-terminal domain [Desulfarculus sp.]
MANSPAAASAPPPGGGLARLRAEVLDQGLCVACGACLGLCPHLVFHDGRVAAPDACGLDSGRCLDLCPQAIVPGPEARRQDLAQTSDAPWWPELGPVRQACWARTTAADLAGQAQYGGVVSTLAALALETGLVGEMVLTQAGLEGAPEGVRVTDRAGVLAAAGSIYAAGAGLMQLNQALGDDAAHPVGVVGLPCQVWAARALRGHPNYPAADRLQLVIGLFCTLNLDLRRLRAVLNQAGVDQPILRADFPPPPAGVLELTLPDGARQIPLDHIRPAVLAGCSLCPDLTAEAADISVGAAEGQPGWNTVLVRSVGGERLWSEALARGLVETRPLPEETRGHLRGAAEAKRQRGLAAGKERRHE